MHDILMFQGIRSRAREFGKSEILALGVAWRGSSFYFNSFRDTKQLSIQLHFGKIVLIEALFNFVSYKIKVFKIMVNSIFFLA